MAYSNFTLARLRSKYGLLQQDIDLFGKINITLQSPGERLLEDLSEAKELPMMTEKAKSEAIIFPIIREVRRNNPQIGIFSGYALNIESDKELNGSPDFMISARPNRAMLEAPLFCLVEAKNGLIEEGYGQCAAEMYAAMLFNKENKEKYQTIYGAVTNAYDWVFLKLEDSTIFIDKERYFLNDLPRILGIFQFIVDQAETSQ